MPIGFVPASLRYGKSLFPAQPDESGLTSEMQNTLLNILSGMPVFDPSSARFSPIPPQHIMSPAQRAAQTATGPGQIAGGLEGTVGLPFSTQIGLDTGAGQVSGRSYGVQPSPTSPVAPAPAPAPVSRTTTAQAAPGAGLVPAAPPTGHAQFNNLLNALGAGVDPSIIIPILRSLMGNPNYIPFLPPGQSYGQFYGGGGGGAGRDPSQGSERESFGEHDIGGRETA